MRVRAEHRGRELPFERERRIVLQRLPQGATITRAVITVSPYSTDEGRRFLETITFGDGVGDWGATKLTAGGSLEVDLHARRKLAGLTGTDLTSRPLLVDLGGGFMSVNRDGGLADGSPLELQDSAELPGLTVTGLRVPGAGTLEPDLSMLRVSSPPSNVTMAVEGGPIFWTFFGDLVGPQSTPDFAAVLQAMLPDLDVVHGHYVVPFVVRSDSIARLDLTVEIEHTVVMPVTPEGVASVHTEYRYDGVPDAGAGLLSVRVPEGMVARPGGATGRVQGAFEPTRVVHGSVGHVSAVEQPSVSAAGPLAQPLDAPGPVLATSVDLLVAAVTAEVTVAVDVVDDLDGKPGRSSRLPRAPELTVTRDQAPAPTWVNVELPAELELDGGRCWVVVHTRDGVATWGADAAPSPGGPGLQQTRDGGLSWRSVPGVTTPGTLAAHLRLRHSTRTFHMPLELRASTKTTEVGVSLQRFAAQGSVDLELGAIGVPEAINSALAASSVPVATAEHVANGDFTEWFRVGSDLARAGELVATPVRYEADGEERTAQPRLARAAFSPDGATVYVVGGVTKRVADGRTVDETYALAFEPLGRTELYARPVGPGRPGPMVMDRGGGMLAVALSTTDFRPSADAGSTGGLLVLVDTRNGSRVGTPVDVAEHPVAMTSSADASAVYLLGRGADGDAVVRRVGWRELMATARGGAPLDPRVQPSAEVSGFPRAITVAPDGRVYVVTSGETASRLVALPADLSLPATGKDGVVTVPNVRDVAVTAAGDELLVLGEEQLAVVRRADLRTASSVTVPAPGRRVGVDPVGVSAIVLQDDVLDVFDSRRRRMRERPELTAFGLSEIAFSPTGTHVVLTDDGATEALLLQVGAALPAEWELTEGQVRPAWLNASSGTLAVLGSLTVEGLERAGRRDIAFGPGALSQVVAAAGGQRYRFSFSGISTGEGGVAELVWRSGDCVPARIDRVPVDVLDLDRTETLQRLPRHELLVSSPATADQVEVRFRSADGLMGIDSVSLTGTSDALSDPAVGSDDGAGSAWEAAPGVGLTPTGAGVTISNGGGVPAGVAQLAAVSPGQRFDLVVSARGTEHASVEVDFRDSGGAPVGDGVRLELGPLAFDQRAASGDVPPGASEAEVRLVVPPGGSVELTGISLTVAGLHDVQVGFTSEAPGELTVSAAGVELDAAEPSVPSVPDGGLCSPAPPGPDGGEQCYCTRCGKQRPVRRPEPVVTDAGRPGVVTPCPSCGTARVRMGGRHRRHARRGVPLPRFRVGDRATVTRRPATRLLAPLRVEASLVELRGIAENRAADLRGVGITTVVALAAAEVDVVAALPGVSTTMAQTFIAEAARMVQERGVRVLLDVT